MRTITVLILIAAIVTPLTAFAQWAPAEGHILSKFASDVDPDAPLPEYPRPQFVRESWLNLNGLWDYAITGQGLGEPDDFDGKILVPFCVESALSGVKKSVATEEELWYQRAFDIPAAWDGQRVLLHFGAVDWDCTVWVNETEVGSHRGGYAPFSFDITDSLKGDGNKLTVRVWDPTNDGYQPRGKQVNDPEGIWYTAVTGIWGTVWLEPVPQDALTHVHFMPEQPQKSGALFTPYTSGNDPDTEIEITIRGNGEAAAIVTTQPGVSVAASPFPLHQWTPDDPFLYDVIYELKKDGEVIDRVTSYIGMRDVCMGKDKDGINRILLNDKPIFNFGPLDQGWWPDGLYTAPTDEALRYDIEVTKAMGFNATRKHVKVEPARWYYWCDKLGLMVWQDMPNGDAHIGRRDPDIQRSKESADNYYHEWGEIMSSLHNHPSIIMWVPFNEGWGQFDTEAVTSWTMKKDPLRLVNQASGWTDRDGGHVLDVHRYPGPGRMPDLEHDRIVVLGEFGGLGLPIKGHTWQDENNWGYRGFETVEELRTAYAELMEKFIPKIAEGHAAAIYTQITDVEIEVNGLLTYDRAVNKLGAEWLKEQNAPISNSFNE